MFPERLTKIYNMIVFFIELVNAKDIQNKWSDHFYAVENWLNTSIFVITRSSS